MSEIVERAASPARPPPPAAPALRRELRLFSATMIVVGGIIGGGIFFTPSEVARALPSAEWIFAIWALGGVVALAGALTYAELGAMLPGAGGAYVYIREAFGELPAFLYGWMLLAIIAAGADAAVALAFARYLGELTDIGVAGGPLPVAAGTIAVLTATNYLGIKPGAAVQNALTLAKIGALALLIAGGLVAWGRLSGAAPPSAGQPAAVPPLAAGLAAAFVPVLFSVGGWQQVNMVASEIRDPERRLPRALFLGIAIVLVCYLGVNAVYLLALGRDGLAASTAVAADTATRIFGPRGATMVTVAAMLSILGIVNVVLLATPRVFFAMARDGVFFRSAAMIHPRFGTPHISILLMGGWAVALLVLSRGDIGQLLSGVVFADWIFFGLGAASVFALRRARPTATRPYRVWGYPVIPGFFVLAAVVAVASALWQQPRASGFGMLLLAVGVALFYVARRGPRGPAGAALAACFALTAAAPL